MIISVLFKKLMFRVFALDGSVGCEQARYERCFVRYFQCFFLSLFHSGTCRRPCAIEVSVKFLQAQLYLLFTCRKDVCRLFRAGWRIRDFGGTSLVCLCQRSMCLARYLKRGTRLVPLSRACANARKAVWYQKCATKKSRTQMVRDFVMMDRKHESLESVSDAS